jgi:hypothetical protein
MLGEDKNKNAVVKSDKMYALKSRMKPVFFSTSTENPYIVIPPEEQNFLYSITNFP